MFTVEATAVIKVNYFRRRGPHNLDETSSAVYDIAFTQSGGACAGIMFKQCLTRPETTSVDRVPFAFLYHKS